MKIATRWHPGQKWWLLAWLLMEAQAGGAQVLDGGRGLAAKHCAVCHQINGVSRSEHYPNLAGQKRSYLVRQLRQFRSGARENALMNAAASGLSNADIHALATYYSTLPPR
jgi:cytochrome c553